MSVQFLDSGFMIALHAVRDQHHALAASYWRSLTAHPQLVTTTFVLVEVVTLLNARDGHARAVSVGMHLRESPSIDLIQVDDELLDEGWRYFSRHGDKRYSLTDCIWFVVMQQRGLRQALTFDQHFAQAGFECLPDVDSAG